tara:strand:- start:2344 stop:2532 length:189 start_codon:yes stop_codon:yes gene_type:complete
MSYFEYEVTKLIKDKIDSLEQELSSMNITSFDKYKYVLGKLHEMQKFQVDYREIKERTNKDE